MVTDGQRVTAAESIAQGVATTVLKMGWLTAWEDPGFLHWRQRSTRAVPWRGTDIAAHTLSLAPRLTAK